MRNFIVGLVVLLGFGIGYATGAQKSDPVMKFFNAKASIELLPTSGKSPSEGATKMIEAEKQIGDAYFEIASSKSATKDFIAQTMRKYYSNASVALSAVQVSQASNEALLEIEGLRAAQESLVVGK